MPIRQITLDEASDQHRADYARNFLNLALTGTEDPAAIRAKIEAAQPNVSTIFINEPDAPADIAAAETAPVELRSEEAAGRSTGTLGKGDPRARIFIPIVDTEDGSGARDVLVGVNGRGWQIKRGMDADVPWRVVEAMKNAKMHVVRHSQEEGREGEVVINVADRFGFQLLEGPTPNQVAEWLERTGAEFCA